MAELSKEYFDKKLDNLVTKEDLTKQVEKLVTIEILDEKFEEQAQLINRAFQEQKDHFDKRIDELITPSTPLTLRGEFLLHKFSKNSFQTPKSIIILAI